MNALAASMQLRELRYDDDAASVCIRIGWRGGCVAGSAGNTGSAGASPNPCRPVSNTCSSTGIESAASAS